MSTSDMRHFNNKIGVIKNTLNILYKTENKKIYKLTKDFFDTNNLLKDIIINFSKNIIDKEKINQISTVNVLNFYIYIRKIKSINNKVKLGFTPLRDLELDDCSICLEKMVDEKGNVPEGLSRAHHPSNTSFENRYNDSTIQMWKRSHIFHTKCLNRSIRVKRVCPLCNATNISPTKLTIDNSGFISEEIIPININEIQTRRIQRQQMNRQNEIGNVEEGLHYPYISQGLFITTVVFIVILDMVYLDGSIIDFMYM